MAAQGKEVLPVPRVEEEQREAAAFPVLRAARDLRKMPLRKRKTNPAKMGGTTSKMAETATSRRDSGTIALVHQSPFRR
jgi:hypothetical protein